MKKQQISIKRRINNMTEIYSDYFQNGVYFTPPKNDILGVVKK
nr:MAG TPA: hypothetical protein [Caudoviricetes sp.]DAK02105.1 MAG TPA: hypothetical protein [Caudoviricetes sp.]